MKVNEFVEKIKEKGLELSEKQLNQFDKYLKLIQEWNEKMNLTSITDDEAVYEKHFYDCLLTIDQIDFNDKSLLDIGAGAGFPSIPLKIAYPSLKLTVLDSLQKRMIFIEEVVKQLQLSDVNIVVSRAEDYALTHRESFDIVTSRAVARLNILAELSLPLVKINGTFMPYKGQGAYEEYEECKNGITTLGGKLCKIQEGILPSENAKRYNLFIVKEKTTPNKYPRQYNKIKKSPIR